MTDQAIETLLAEERRYPPPRSSPSRRTRRPTSTTFLSRSSGSARGASGSPGSSLSRPCSSGSFPTRSGILGGKINVTYNCLDRHVEAGLGEKVAFYFEAEPVGERAAITYAQLLEEVVKAANGLKELGVGKGTPVGIYMGMGPGLPVAMLACARLGAPHTVVFGGFSAEALADRLNDMRCEILLTQDEGWRRGQTVPLKENADEALESCPGIRKVVVGQRTRGEVPMTAGRDLTWSELVEGQPSDAGVVSLRADGLGRPSLPPVHERDDREAEGDRSHDGGVPGRRGDDPPVRLRPEARHRRLLVRRGHRLGHGAQLHRLRAALQRDDQRPLRGHARLPRQGPLVGHRRALRRHDPVHGADGDPGTHEVGAGARGRSTTSRLSGCSEPSASRSTRRPGSGIASTSAPIVCPSSTPGGRRRPG